MGATTIAVRDLTPGVVIFDSAGLALFRSNYRGFCCFIPGFGALAQDRGAVRDLTPGVVIVDRVYRTVTIAVSKEKTMKKSVKKKKQSLPDDRRSTALKSASGSGGRLRWPLEIWTLAGSGFLACSALEWRVESVAEKEAGGRTRRGGDAGGRRLPLPPPPLSLVTM